MFESLYADDGSTNRFATAKGGLSGLVRDMECRNADDYAQCAVESREFRPRIMIDTKPSAFWYTGNR